MRCPRQAWLQDQLAGDTNDKAVIGQLLHELLQWALSRALEEPGQQAMGDGNARGPISKEELMEEV